MVEKRRTSCNRDCPDACSIIATVENGRVLRLQGDPEHPVTQGFLCHRTQQFLHQQYAPDRITTPLLRCDGQLKPVSWDKALNIAAKQLRTVRAESGPASIFHYRSGGTLGMVTAAASDLFFEQFGPVTIKRGDICSGAGEAAQEADFGISDSNHLFDLENARQILLWGKNVYTSSPHTLPVLKRAQSAGAELVLIDPVYQQTAKLCQHFVQPRPGGDFDLAMAVARVLFDQSWVHPEAASYCDKLDEFTALVHQQSLEGWCRAADVSVDEAEDLAQRLHHGPSAILVGWGMGRRVNGGRIVRALDALGAISGNLGIPGGGVSFYFRRRGAFRSLTRGLKAAPRSICEPLFGAEVLAAQDPPVRLIWVTAGNPVAMLPESDTVAEALRSREFVVVVDSWLSDTAALADLVLPVTTLLEADDLLGAYGHHHISEVRPVVPPPAEVKTDLQIFQALAERLDLSEVMSGSADIWKQRLLSTEVQARGVTMDSLKNGAQRNPLANEILFADHQFPTATGRMQLLSELPPCSPVPPIDTDFPLTLLSLSTPRSQSSQWVKGRVPSPITVTVHPEASAGIANGSRACLRSRRGHLEVLVAHDHRQRKDVAIMPKGGHWRNGTAANALITARTTDLGEGGALYDEPVRLEALR